MSRLNLTHFTHTDLDGVSCAVIAQLIFKNVYEYEPVYCDYNEVDEQVRSYINKPHTDKDFLLITDISVNQETAEMIENLYNNDSIRVLLLDHHKTADYLNDYDWANVDTSGKTCGAEMLKRLPNNPAPSVINIDMNSIGTPCAIFSNAVRQYDTWTYDKTYCCLPLQLNILLYLMGRQSFVEYCIDAIKNSVDGIGFSINESSIRSIIRNKYTEMKEYAAKKAEQSKLIECNGYNVAYVFAEDNISLTGNEVALKWAEQADYAAVIDLSNKRVHLRSINDNIDLGKIAAQYGGGGHPKAAAYDIKELDESIVARILKMEE